MCHPNDKTKLSVSLRSLGYSLRRYYVDEYHFRNVPGLRSDGMILDLGGNRTGKRGAFDIDVYGLDVVYANLSAGKHPDVQADAAVLPFPDGVFVAVICSELLEHVPDPVAVLREISRVLAPEGQLLVCVPFLARIHGDPYDYGRYTDFYWLNNLEANGFRKVVIEKQGLFWSVLTDMFRDLAVRATMKGFWSRPAAIRLLAAALAMCKRLAIRWDDCLARADDSSASGFTTGFGIRATRKK